MDQSKQNSKYSKPRQSNKSRVGGISTENVLNSNSDQSVNCGYQPQSSQHCTGGLVRSKPCREIYRPPNCRKGRSNQPNAGPRQNYYSFNTLPTTSLENGTHLSHKENPHQLQENSLTTTNAPRISNPGNSSQTNPGFRALNIHAKEFHFKPTATTGIVQPENRMEESKTPYYGIVATAESSEIVQPQPTNFYSLYQSKSSGHIADMLPEQNNNLACTEQRSAFQGFSNFSSHDDPSEQSLTSRLQQSKSSGNIPARSKVVRFDDEIQKNDEENRIFDQLLNSTNSLRIAGEAQQSSMNANARNFEITQPRMPFLQKSRTTVHMGISSHTNLQLNEYPDYMYRNYHPQQRPAFVPSSVLIRNPNYILTTLAPAAATPLKRSKSFNAQNKHFGNPGEDSLRSSGILGEAKPIYPPRLNFDDFCITKWPKAIQELITSAVTGGERVPPRNRMQLVTSIFEILLDGKGKNICPNGEIERTGEWYNLTIPAVHIFLYLIQREKDHTVMESLMNTCFAIFQSLSSSQSSDFPQPVNPPKWNVFLSFLCTFYCQVKVSRIQQNVGSSTDRADRVCMTFLALLCDSCLATFRSLPTCHSPEIMDCLFTVMTSIGRDMEKSFPQKMKQILTSVRDALLGLGPYEVLAEAPPIVQKTLMQLIELHAANWHLPASAVRYYYAHPNSHADQPIKS